MIKKTAFSIIALLVSLATLSAQDYFIEVTPDKKIIHLTGTVLPEDTPVQYILQIMPELIKRGDLNFSNYDLQLDGKSVGASRDNILSMLDIKDLDKIEISTSSVSTQQKSGMSGAINFVTRTPNEGLEGEETMEATTIPNIMPNAEIMYKKGKLELTGYGNMQYYNPKQEKTYTSIFKNSTDIGRIQDNFRYTQATARVNAKYSFTEKDELKGWLLLSSSKEYEQQTQEYARTISGLTPLGPGWSYFSVMNDTSYSDNRVRILNVLAEYKHTFGEDHKLTVSAGYQLDREDKCANYVIPNTLDAEVKYDVPLFIQDGHKLQMKLALNYTGKIVETDDAGSSSLYLSPLAEFKYTTDKWTVIGAARYQMYDRYYSYKENLRSKDFSSIEHDIIGNVNALWQFEPHKAVRFTLSRNLLRPSDEMLYPELVWYQSKKEWIMGNPKLSRAYLHTIEADYIMDWERKGRYFTFNAGLQYNRADDLIQTVRKHDDESGTFYNTFINSGKNDILATNLLLTYNYEIFSFAVAGNLFCNFKKENGVRNYYNFFNLSFSPIFNFEGGWNLSGKMVYNSAVLQAESELGDCLLATIRLDKKYRQWLFHVELNDIFDYKSSDYTNVNDNNVSVNYDMYRRYFGIGATYQFKLR